MPLEVSKELRWLQRHDLGGYLRVIDAPPHPEAQEIARQLHPDTVTNNLIRSALGLQRGGVHDIEVPSHTILEAYFGTYSVFGKAYRTYGGPNKFFSDIARILMEYVFAHTNPTSMPQKKAAIITTAYQGGIVDWGILTGEGVRAALSSFQSGKRFLPMLAHYLMAPPLPETTIKNAKAEGLDLKPRRMGRHHTKHTFLART